MEDDSDFPSYVGVEFFYDEKNEVVPNSWIKQRKSGYKCRYPPTGTDVQNLSRANKRPETNWESFRVKILTYSGK